VGRARFDHRKARRPVALSVRVRMPRHDVSELYTSAPTPMGCWS